MIRRLPHVYGEEVCEVLLYLNVVEEYSISGLQQFKYQ